MNRIRVTTFLLLLALGVAGALEIVDVYAQQSGSACMDLLTTAAANAWVEGEVRNFEDLITADGTHSCLVEYVVSSDIDEKTVFLLLNETNITPETSCTYVPLEQFQETTFHGYAARTFYRKNPNGRGETFETKALGWCMHKGGRNYYFEVSTSSSYIDKLGPARDPVPISDQLWSLAEERLPLTPETAEDFGPVTGGIEETEPPAAGLEVPQVEPGQAGAEQEKPEVVVVPYGEGASMGNVEGEAGTFEYSWQSREARGLRSAVLPLLGGLIGVGVSLFAGQGAARVAGAAGAMTVQPVAAPPVIPPAEPPAVPPLPEAPPPLTAEELHTQEMLKQGMVYSDSAGWQTPEQVRQSAAWQANDRAAVEAEDAAWQRDYEKERLDLEQNREEMEKAGKELDAELKLTDLKLKMHQLQRELLNKHHYVFNPNQGIPVWDALTQARNYVMDTVFRTKGLTCEGYVDNTFPKIKESVKELYGDKAVVEVVKFDEMSSVNPRQGWCNPGAWKDWCDAFVDDNHVLTRIVLPDKTELGADFHQYNAKNRPDILMPFEESRKVWKPYLGDHEFRETVIDR